MTLSPLKCCLILMRPPPFEDRCTQVHKALPEQASNQEGTQTSGVTSAKDLLCRPHNVHTARFAAIAGANGLFQSIECFAHKKHAGLQFMLLAASPTQVDCVQAALLEPC